MDDVNGAKSPVVEKPKRKAAAKIKAGQMMEKASDISV
jgi:hypothetical protein